MWRKSSKSYANGNCVEVRFRKSSRSESANCVEVAAHCGTVDVRDSKNPDGPVLTFTPDAWTAFLGGVKTGELG